MAPTRSKSCPQQSLAGAPSMCGERCFTSFRSRVSHTPLVAVLGATGLAFFMHGGLYAQAAAKPNADEQAVLTVNDRLEAAVLASDTATFRQGFAAEYLFITATGAVRPRDEVLRYYGAKEVAWRVYRTDSISVRLFGDAAVVPAGGGREGGWGACSPPTIARRLWLVTASVACSSWATGVPSWSPSILCRRRSTGLTGSRPLDSHGTTCTSRPSARRPPSCMPSLSGGRRPAIPCSLRILECSSRMGAIGASDRSTSLRM